MSSVQTYVLQSSCELNRLSHGFLRVTLLLSLISVLLGDISPSEAFGKEVRIAVVCFYIQENKTLHLRIKQTITNNNLLQEKW